MPEREIPFSSINTLSTEKVDAAYVLPDDRETRVEMLAFTPVGMAVNALKMVFKNKVVFVASGAALALGFAQGMGVEARADLDAADTKAEVELIEFTPEQKIETAVARFGEQLSATNISYIIDVNLPLIGDKVPDCEGNKQLEGIGTLRFGVPLEAVSTSAGTNGKTNLTVDSSGIEVVPYWEGAGPTIRDFTLNEGGTKKNFDDRKGFCSSATSNIAGAMQLLNINGFPNLIQDLDNNINHDLKVKALNVMTEKCATQLDEPNKKAVKDALIATVVKMGDAEKLGEITFTDEKLNWKVDKMGEPKKGKIPIKGGDMLHRYNFKDFSVDKVNCTVDPAVTGGGS